MSRRGDSVRPHARGSGCILRVSQHCGDLLKLRTQILILLFLFGFAPMTAIVVTNLPFVLERLEFFYHKAHLQNLRADFRDLDEHLAIRHEMLRLLAKLPEPGLILGDRGARGEQALDQARARYTEWINRILRDHLDIFQILFLDLQGKPRFWLELDAGTRQWVPTLQAPEMPAPDFFKSSVHQGYGRVAVSKIALDPAAAPTDPRRFMTLRMISQIIAPDGRGRVVPLGAVVVTLDVGGMARTYPDTLWVTGDGAYLQERLAGQGEPRAFRDFPGLEEIFKVGNLALWEREGRQVVWVPLFSTEGSVPLWVGRRADPSPLARFRNVLINRVMTIVVVSLVLLLLVARRIALRAEQLGQKLGEGIGKIVGEHQPVRFEWRRPRELKQLGEQLTALAETHARQVDAQQEHARQLEESNRYKTEFLANVSHELRTPLNSILLLSKVLNEGAGGLTPEQRKQLRVIHEAGSDLRALIDNILDLSKIEAGEAGFSLQHIPLGSLAQDLIELVKPQFEAKGLGLHLVLEEALPETVLTDQEKLRQILKNFLSNALKFTDQGEVTLRLYRQPDRQRPVCFAVEDSGVGIAPGKHELIFEAFKQADGSTSRRYGGTGLGLSISRQLAHLLGGEIRLQSDEGRGAVFTLCLPLAPGSLEAQQADLSGAPPRELAVSDPLHPSRESPEVAQERHHFAGLRVLLVDDELRNLLALTPRLEAWGFEVAAAGDAQEAMETLKEDPAFGLVLVDLLMPGRSGYDTISEIREKLRPAAPVIIAMGLDGSAQVREACLRAGADDCLVDPLDAEALWHCIEARLGEA